MNGDALDDGLGVTRSNVHHRYWDTLSIDRDLDDVLSLRHHRLSLPPNRNLRGPSLPTPTSYAQQIKAFGLNRMDIMQRQGKYPLPPQASKTIMGVEFAGEVVKLDEAGGESANGERWKLGDEVVGLAYGVRLESVARGSPNGVDGIDV